MRSDDDQWDITSSVGVTALGVASGRAMETERADGLVDDPYAADFVAAATASPGADPALDLPTTPVDDPDWAAQSTYIGVRSRCFDEFFARAADAGNRQVVLLASGLDTRAQRLDWPTGTTVFEIDQQAVLDFKDEVLATHAGSGAGGGAERVLVRVDLRHDWPAALRDAGFDPTVPTAWLAEGLLPYLPADAEADLFARVGELSAAGSRIAVEHFGTMIDDLDDDSVLTTMSARLGVDVRDLFLSGDREDPADRLRAAGWTVDATRATDLAASYGRPLDEQHAAVFGAVLMLEAQLPA